MDHITVGRTCVIRERGPCGRSRAVPGERVKYARFERRLSRAADRLRETAGDTSLTPGVRWGEHTHATRESRVSRVSRDNHG